VGSTSVEATFVYGDVLPSNTNVPSLSVAETIKWGQSEAPVYTAAVFDSQKAITLDGQNTPQVSQLSSEWRLASFFFTDASGTLTNTANYGNSKWLFTATLMDANKNVYAGFDADGIEKVLTRTEQDGFGSFDPTIYASKTTFETQIRGQEVTAGLYVKETWSPVRTVMLQGVATQVRTHTSYSYDENAPTSALYGLVTSQVVGLVPGDGASSTNLTQLSKSVNIYDPIDGSSATGATSGWTLKSPTLVKLFDADNQLISETKAIFNQYGQVTKTISAGSTGADGRSEVYTYYSNAPNTIHPECGSKPEWEFLLCYTEYPTTPLLPNRWISEYDYRLNASRIDEVNLNGIQRTTKNTYLDDSRIYETTIEVVGNQSLTTRNLYDPVKLINNGTERYIGTTLQSATHKTFDDYGRQTSYTNSLGETETTAYIPGNQLGAGSLQTVTNQQNTITYTYGSANEPRSLVTALTVQGANYLYEYNATYDQLGRLTKQTGPNNLYQAFSYTDSKQIASMSYGSQTTTWFTWQRTYDGYGHVATETEPNSSDSSQKVNYFTYDPSDRLTSNEVVTDTSCNKNSYSYDNAGNRLTKTVTTNSCSNPTSTTTSHSYNSFSQLTNTGYVYDQLGRNTFIPSADAPNQNGAISLAYNINDKVTFIGQNNTSTSFTYEAEDRRLNETSNGVTTTRHYTDSSDNPTWTTQTVNGQTKTETYSPSLGTGLNATTTTENNTVTTQIQLYDLRGNTATTVDPTTNTATSWNNYDEFGNPAATNPANTNLIKYNTYGQAERATNTTGLILMGARAYNPATNQFTTEDPISGGNENSYTYPNDPISKSDFNGMWGWLDTLDAVLTIASFIPATAVVAGAVKLGMVVYKAVSLVAKASRIVATAKNFQHANALWGTVKATRFESGLAGRIWTKSLKFQTVSKGPRTSKALLGTRNGKPVQYRPPKAKSGQITSNLEQFELKHNDYDTMPRFNFHIEIQKGKFW
jgi:RHS repeat-associated protein